MAINFPHNPNPNDVHTESSLGKSWRWDGTTWLIYSSSTTGIGYSDLSVTTEAAQGGGSLTYNDANGQFTFRPSAGGGGGATNFTGLGDTPGSLTAGKWLKVNVGGTALEWTDAPAGNDTNDYLNTASLSGTTLTLTRTGTQSLSDVTVDLSSLNSVPTNITVVNESTDTECYPLFTTEATGNLAPKTVTSFKLNSSSGQLEAGSFKKTGGSSAEFLKADGSVDSTTYLSSNPSYALNDLSNVDAVTGVANGKILKYNGTSWEVADDQSGGGGGGGGNVAVGSVMIWSGSAVSIPSGWQLCDGTNGSPDLRDRFVVGAGSTYAVDATGGSADAVVVSHNHGITDPGHDHDVEVVTDSGSGNNSNVDQNDSNSNGVNDTTGIASNSTGISVNSEGVSGTNANLPPYYALCYIYCTAAGSNQTFIGLGDTPGSYTANQWLKVNSAGNGVEFTTAPSDNNTTYDLTASDGSVVTEEKIILTGSDSSEDAVTLAVSGSLTIARSNNTITFGGGGGGSTPTLDDVLTAGNTSTSSIEVGNATVGVLNVTANDIILNSDFSGSSPSANVSLKVERGNSADVSIRWNETTDTWQYTNDGSSFSDITGGDDTLDTVTGRGATTTNDVTVGNFICSNLTVNGTTTTVNSNTVNIGDNILRLNSDEAGTPSQNGGIEIERGTSANVAIRWNETTDKWEYTNDGSTYQDITDTNTDTNTTYDLLVPSSTTAISLDPSSGTADNVTITGGTNVTVTRTSGTELTISSTDTNTTYSSFTGTTPGLVPDGTSAGSTKFLKSDGSWDDVSVTESDTLASVTSRGSSTTTACTFQNVNIDGSLVTGALNVTDPQIWLNSDLGASNPTENVAIKVNRGNASDVEIRYNESGDKWEATNDGSNYFDVGGGVPAGTIVMYNSTTAPSGWALCDGGSGRPDLRDRFVVGAGSSYNQGSTGGQSNVSLSTSQMPSHTHGDGNYGTNNTGSHTHDDGNYDAALNGSHTHQANVTANTQNQSANHYHTIGGNKPDGSPGTWNATASGGNHGHSYRESNGHPQSNMAGIQRSGGDSDNATNNTDILSSGGSHNHNVNLTGVTTGGVDQNHYHSMSFNINTSPPLTNSEHSHNVSGNSGSAGNHSHNVTGSSGSQGSGNAHENKPPYYAITFIIKT